MPATISTRSRAHSRDRRPAQELTVAVGLNKTPDRQGPGSEDRLHDGRGRRFARAMGRAKNPRRARHRGDRARDAFRGYAEDDTTGSCSRKSHRDSRCVTSVGAGWSEAGEFTSEKAWNDYVAACAARAARRVTVTRRRHRPMNTMPLRRLSLPRSPPLPADGRRCRRAAVRRCHAAGNGRSVWRNPR